MKETVHMKMRLTCTFIFKHIKMFWYDKFCTKPRFETEAKPVSQVAYRQGTCQTNKIT